MAGQGARSLALLVPGLVCLGIAAAAGVQLYEGLMSDVYWTPLESAPDLDDAGQEVEVWLDDDLLQRQAEQGRLRDPQGRDIDASRLRVRLNRRDRVQRAQIAVAAGAGGAGLAFLVSAAMVGRGRRKGGDP